MQRPNLDRDPYPPEGNTQNVPTGTKHKTARPGPAEGKGAAAARNHKTAAPGPAGGGSSNTPADRSYVKKSPTSGDFST